MTPEKILSVVALYKKRLTQEGVSPKRIDSARTFSSLSREEILAHVYYLIGNVEEMAKDPSKEGKTGRHLGSLQTLLSFAGWYTLEDLMNHNRP